MTPDLLQPANCACFNLRRAARQITQAYDQALKPAGLAPTQFTLLSVLAGNDDGQGLPVSQLAKYLGMDRTTLTRNLQPVEKAGWVSVKAGLDRRERLVALTIPGRRKLKQALPLWQTAQSRTMETLGADNLRDLIKLTESLAMD